jgi:hypothetical protein
LAWLLAEGSFLTLWLSRWRIQNEEVAGNGDLLLEELKMVAGEHSP